MLHRRQLLLALAGTALVPVHGPGAIQGTDPDRRRRAAHRPVRAVRRAVEEGLRPGARRDQCGGRHQRTAAAVCIRGHPERPAPNRHDCAQIRRRRAHRGRGRRLLQRGLDGGLADLPGGRHGAVRLHQFAPGFHQGRRLHLEQRRQPEGRDAAAGGLRARPRPEEDRGAAPQQRLGAHREGHPGRGGEAARRRGGRQRGLSGGREGFPLRDRARCAAPTRIRSR